MPVPDLPILITILRAAEVTGVSRRTLYRWMDDKEVETKFIGRSRLIVTESLLAKINSLPQQKETA